MTDKDNRQQEEHNMTEKLFDFLYWVDDTYGALAVFSVFLVISAVIGTGLAVLTWVTNGYIFALLPLFVVYLVYKYTTRDKG